MEAIKTKSWEDFERKLKKLRAENGTESSPLLFLSWFSLKWRSDVLR
jgi:hypothetical protein